MPSWAKALIRLAVALVEWWKERKAHSRVDAVRADPGTEWVRKMGGSDNRVTPPSPKDPGRSGDG